MNLNELARKITLKEGLKESISIAQVKEVMKILFIELSLLEEKEVLAILKRYRKKYLGG